MGKHCSEHKPSSGAVIKRYAIFESSGLQKLPQHVVIIDGSGTNGAIRLLHRCNSSGHTRRDQVVRSDLMLHQGSGVTVVVAACMTPHVVVALVDSQRTGVLQEDAAHLALDISAARVLIPHVHLQVVHVTEGTRANGAGHPFTATSGVCTTTTYTSACVLLV